MRAFLLRATVLGVLAVATVGWAQPTPPRTPPPDLKKLKDELEAMVKEREKKDTAAPDPGSSAERVELRLKLLKMIDQIGQQRATPAVPAVSPTKPEVAPGPKPVEPKGTDPKGTDPKTKPDPFDGATPIDPLRSAQNLFKAGDVEAAYRTLKMTKLEALSREDRVFAQYLTACCLRKTGKASEAMVLYRELATANEDEFITECCLWQLSTLRSTQELQDRLQELRVPPKTK